METANRTNENSMTGPTGWYSLWPEGGSWVAVLIGEDGQCHGHIEAANAETHIAARDRYAVVAQAVLDDETDPQVTADHADAVVAAWNRYVGRDESPADQVVVECVVCDD